MLSWWIVLILVVLFLLIVGLALWLMFRKQDYVPYGKKFRLRLTTTTSIRSLFLKLNAMAARLTGRTSGLSRDTLDTLMQLQEIPITFRCTPKPADNLDTTTGSAGLSNRTNTGSTDAGATGAATSGRLGPINLSASSARAISADPIAITAEDIYDRYDCTFYNEIYSLLTSNKNKNNKNRFQQEQYWTAEHMGLVLNIKVDGVWVRYIPVMIMDGRNPNDITMVRADRPLPADYTGIKLTGVNDGYFSKAIVPCIKDRTFIIPFDDIVKYVELYIAASAAAGNMVGRSDSRGDQDEEADGLEGSARVLEALEQDDATGKYFVPCPDRLSGDVFFLDFTCRPLKG